MTSNTPYPLPQPRAGKTTIRPGACSPVRSSYVIRINDPEIRQLALDLGGKPSRAMQGGIEFENRANAQIVTTAMQQKASAEARAKKRGLSDEEYEAALERLCDEVTSLCAPSGA